MDFKELKKMSVAELNKLLAKYREQTREMRFSINAKQQKNIREIRPVKKTIAHILTLLNNEILRETGKKEEIKK
ncbi:MAG: 50S ribosomal protein L29 [Candidatus Komeilibacteria bacterium]|nr:50S ribosomal protein L29 [Candidatus Komeilibacteria bacterium]